MKQTLGARMVSRPGIATIAVILALLTAGVWYGAASCGGRDNRVVRAGAGPANTAGSEGTQRSGALPSAPATASRGPWWHPAKGLSWQWQLTGPLNTTIDADVYDIDLDRATAADVAALHKAGRKVICYVNVGAYENFRADAGRFPKTVLGNVVDGWNDERWVDVRQWTVLQPILAARLAACKQKGFDAVEPDNVDGFLNESGFPLTAADQLAFNRAVADLVHRSGMAVGLKNDLEQAADLQPAFDFAVNEECVKYRECPKLKVFVGAGKAVFHVEYELPLNSFCSSARALGLSSIHKRADLDAWREAC